ncbi:sensor histidine kinase [Aneurinibacillus migulanus]|uniref:sensor histidine kinase n=1 Tax=Aneurinibacillus migulanus TaxID=47500 RepID=UPI00209CFBC3|nr:ATP-binding protein [Aneurinibacillus migulanus]MCP1356276.1 ATP-binding protein [Aneurinibacillus migulanus]
MRKKQMVLWISAGFLVPILLSAIFALSADLLHLYQLKNLLRKPSLEVFIIVSPAFFCSLFMLRYHKWLRVVEKQQESGLIHVSFRRILHEYMMHSMLSFFLLSFLVTYWGNGRQEDIVLIFLICMGVMITAYAPFYFGLLVRIYDYLYRLGFSVQFRNAGWNQGAVMAVGMAIIGIFVTTTLFVYIISKTIGSAITLYDAWERAFIISIVVGVPLIMLILMIRQFYSHLLQHKHSQLLSLHLLLEKLYGNLELTDMFLEDMVATVKQVIGADVVTLVIHAKREGKERIFPAGYYREGESVKEYTEECSSMRVPIFIDGQTAGYFCLRDKVGALRFTREDGEIMRSFSRAFSMVLQNSHYIEELKKERQVAQEAAGLKSQILSTMSHELRTPLNAIIGYSDIVIDVLRGSVPDKQITNVKRINESGRHLLGVINDILDLSKMEAGQMNATIEPVHMRTLLQFCMHNAENLCGERPIVFSIEGETDIWIRSDEQKLKQIIMNLVSNAVKFTERGSIIVRLSRRARDVIIEVEDTGVGILQEHQTAIFEPFKQIDGSLARKYKGTGLGLSIAARLVSLLGGSICVESEKGQGSRFSIHLSDVFHEQ